jgi:putative FmdB family regulatory protein
MSKLTYYDFLCPHCQTAFDDLVKPDVYQAECPECGEQAKRTVSAVRIDRTAIALTVGASPESIRHFDRVHRQRKAIEERNMQNHGDYGKAAGCD